MDKKELLAMLKKHLILEANIDQAYANTYLDVKLSWVDPDSSERELIEICSTSCNLEHLREMQ